MITYVILIAISSSISGIVIYILTNKYNQAHYLIYTERAKAKAATIEKEAFLHIETSKQKAQQELLNLQQSYENEYKIRQEELEKKEQILSKRIQKEIQDIEDLKNKTKISYDLIDSSLQEANRAKQKADQKMQEAIKS